MKKNVFATVGMILLVVFMVGIKEYLRVPSAKSLQSNITPVITPKMEESPLQIEVMRNKTYPGSEIIIEETLTSGSNYHQYIASYKSDGLKIYALLTVPSEKNPPDSGWPVIIFNHGYIPPEQYKTTERYIAYVDLFARNGYIVLKSDYRGNGNSEGNPEGAYYSPAYATDVINAVSSIKKFKEADPNKIGMWGHSLGGNITLRNIIVSQDIKTAVIWAGVIGSYDDLMNNWHRSVPYQPSPRELTLRNRYRSNMVEKYKTPKENPDFWNSIDPTYFVKDITIPVQLHHGTKDEEVPATFSQSLYDKMKLAGKTVELYIYDGADHNISGNSFNLAMERTIFFFNKYLK